MEKNNISCEPMDIDLSNQSVKEMDISYIDSDSDSKIFKVPSPRISTSRLSNSIPRLSDQSVSPDRGTSTCINVTVKKYHINIQKPPRSYKNIVFKILATTAIVFISIIAFQMQSLKCCDELNLDIFRDTLSNKLYGQSAAINSLMSSLSKHTRSKLLFFTGGTGVGKTFSSSILLDTVGPCSNVYHYTMPTFKNTFSTELMFGLTMCKISLIIVDDLTPKDMDVKVQIKNVIEKSENLGKDIIVILIYNNCNDDVRGFDKTCDNSFNSKLLENFSDIDTLKSVIEFKPLSEADLIECIKQDLGNKKLNDKEFYDVLKNFNVSVDGCKGVHSKMKYLNFV